MHTLSVKMADRDETYDQVFCIEHPKEVLQLFCLDCEDIICVSCNVESHNGHKLSKLGPVKNHLEFRLKTTLKEDVSKLKFQFEEIITEVDRKLEVQRKEEMNMQNDIRETNIKLKERIDEIETASLKLLPGLFEGKQNSLLKIKEQITKCQSLTPETNGISETKENEIESNDFDWIIKNYTSLQQCTKMSRCVKMISDEVGTTYIPLKLVERNRGQFLTESNGNNTLICQNDDLVVIKGESNRQTNNSNEKNVSGSNADFDFSSDDVENEFPITLKIHDLKQQITKIIPISEDIIWIQVGNCLYKLDQEKGSAVKSQDNVDDFTMMNDKSLLLLNKSKQYITRRFQDGRTLQFAGVHPFSPLWLDISEDKVAVVVKQEITQYYPRGVSIKSNCYNVVIFSDKGIKLYETKEVSLPTSYQHILGVKLTKSNSLFFINKKEVVCMDLDTKEKKNFKGIFGMNPSNTFQTTGLTLGPAEETVIVTDELHPAILLLDNNLTFKRCLFDATDKLEKPTSIARYKDRLWVVDGQTLLMFECEVENKK